MTIDETEKLVEEKFGFNLTDNTGSTHLPVLVMAIMNTVGSVIELGTGLYSTPVLHDLCRSRKLISYENYVLYYHMVKGLRNKHHDLRLINDFSLIDYSGHWGVALIDHRISSVYSDRGAAIKKIDADYIVCHDSEPEERWRYGYDDVFPLFKYRFDYTKFKTHTTVLSNRRKWVNL